MASPTADIDDDLVRGIAASAFDTARDGAEAVLASLRPGLDAAELRLRIEAARDGAAGAPPGRASQNDLAAFRRLLAERKLDGFVVPVADEYQGEFIPPCAQRLRWLSGFSGSAGLAVILADEAAIFVDGRYELQVRDEVGADLFELHHLTRSPPRDWLAARAPEGARIGFDPWIHTPNGLRGLAEGCRSAGAELVPAEPNPVDAAWPGRPPEPLGPVMPHDIRHAGVDAADKRRQIAGKIAAAGRDAAVIGAPASVAWLLNVRGSDVANTPLPLSRAIIHRDGRVDWFIDRRKVGDAVLDGLGPEVAVHAPDELGGALDRLGGEGASVLADPASTPEWITRRLAASGAGFAAGGDPCEAAKATKNAVELAGARACHVRDGAALCEFLAWLSREAPDGGVTERSAAERLAQFRRRDASYRGPSFDTISGSGPNGAIVHYRVSERTDRTIVDGDIYLVDSGAQYADGTTDVTRTVFISGSAGTRPSDEVRDRFTRVLKGHIAIATARFPEGTTGGRLDTLARASLWQAGLDYDHGTGHGVGSYLGVHEGPQRVSPRPDAIALEPGMILSNEPGYYRPGAYGIRIENLVVVRKWEGGGEDGRNMLRFETLTLAPVDRLLVEPALLTPGERSWLNGYHWRVRETLAPGLSPAARSWLEEATAPV